MILWIEIDEFEKRGKKWKGVGYLFWFNLFIISLWYGDLNLIFLKKKNLCLEYRKFLKIFSCSILEK